MVRDHGKESDGFIMKKINRKAFTLIELLAVIVILALIMGIATFAITSVVDSSKKSTAELSAKTYISTINKLIVNNLLTSNKLLDGTYLVNNEGNLERNSNEYYIDITHDKPNNGLLVINTSKVESATLIINGYKIVYSNGAYITDNKENETYEEVESVFLKNATVGTLSNYQIYGNSTQNEDPSPTSPATITSLGESGSIEVITIGKNLFLYPSSSAGQYTEIKKIDSGYRTIINVQMDAPLTNYYGWLPAWNNTTEIILPAGIYNLSFNVSGYRSIEGTSSRVDVWFNNRTNRQYLYGDGNKSTSFTHTGGSIRITAFIYDKSITGKSGIFGDYIEVTNIQLEQGSTPTSYEPYASNNVTIDLTGHEPLRKIGNVADYIDYKSGKIIRNIGVNTSFYFANFTVGTNVNSVTIRKQSNDKNLTNFNSNVWTVLSNILEYIAIPSSSDDISYIGKMYNSGSEIYRIVLPKTITTIEEAQSYLANLTVYYQLTTPDDTERITLPKISITSPNSYIKVSGASKVVINN